MTFIDTKRLAILMTQGQTSKKWCFEKHYLCDTAQQSSAL